MSLAIFQTDDKSVQLLQTSWAASLNPVLANPMSNGSLIRNVALASGANAINHKLGRKLQGWCVTRVRAAATIYDTQDSNQHPELTLALNASAPVTVDIYVF